MEKAIEKAGASSLALPAFADRSDSRGSEGIGSNDILIPRLNLAQKMSPEIDASDVKYIDGLRDGDMFSNVLQTNFGKGPLEVVIVRREAPKALEFWPRTSKEGQGVKDREVAYYGKKDPRNDPRAEFGPKGEKPVATVFHEYVAFVKETREPVILSFKATSTPAATALDTFLALRGGPAWATTFRLFSLQQKNEHGPFFVFRVQPGGAVDQETFRYAEAVYESMKGKKVDSSEIEQPEQESVPF